MKKKGRISANVTIDHSNSFSSIKLQRYITVSFSPVLLNQLIMYSRNYRLIVSLILLNPLFRCFISKSTAKSLPDLCPCHLVDTRCADFAGYKWGPLALITIPTNLRNRTSCSTSIQVSTLMNYNSELITSRHP